VTDTDKLNKLIEKLHHIRMEMTRAEPEDIEYKYYRYYIDYIDNALAEVRL